jgi:hypothetical protein
MGSVVAISPEDLPVCGNGKASRTSGCCVQETQSSSGAIYHVFFHLLQMKAETLH